MEKVEVEQKKKNKWFAGYIVAGLIIGISQQINLSKTSGGALSATVVAIVAGIFYHKFKAKLKIKNAVWAFLALAMISTALIGFLTPFANLLFIELDKPQADAHGWTETTRAIYMKDSLDSCGTANPKFCTCLANYLMKKYSFEEIHSMSQDIRDNNASPQGIKDATNYCQTNY